MKKGRFAYVWEYSVRRTHRAEFLAAYGPRGDWVELFSREPGYLETVLLADEHDENRFVTVDFWVSRADRDAFRKAHADEFSRLDQKCEAFTEREFFLGDFVEIDGRIAR